MASERSQQKPYLFKPIEVARGVRMANCQFSIGMTGRGGMLLASKTLSRFVAKEVAGS